MSNYYLIIVKNGAGYELLRYDVIADNENEAMIRFYKDKVLTYDYIVACEDSITIEEL